MNALEMKKKLAAGQAIVSRAVLIYGAAKTGKTLAALELAEEFNILYLDGENGGEVMFQLDDERLSRINWVRINDTRKEPHFIEFLMRFAEGEDVRLCDEHGKLTCSKCVAARAPFTTYNIENYPADKWVIVADSLTQASLSADWLITNKQKLSDGSKFTFEEWRLKGYFLERYLGAVQNSKFNWAVITHEQGIEQEDGTEKLTPSGGTKNFARNNAKYFGAVVYLEVSGGKHRQFSQTTDKPKAITGSRANIDTDKFGLLSLFSPAAYERKLKALEAAKTSGPAKLGISLPKK